MTKEQKDYFVRIQQVFSKPEERSIDSFKEIYFDYSNLLQFIKSVTEAYLTADKVVNKRVLLKPNWVRHNGQESDELCMRTHDNFVLAFLEILLTMKPSFVVIGDAPIQGCNWDKMLSNFFLTQITKLIKKYSIQIEIKDFRRVTFDPSLNNQTRERHPISEYVIFDLGKKSYLESVSIINRNLFRVFDYNPSSLAISHSPGVHKYCITKELFDCDLFISLPKIKTHQKAGITNALKNIVGLNGDKDYLPHHRLGGTNRGGDCYPGDNVFIHFAELTLDMANKNHGKFYYFFLRRLAFLFWHLSFPSPKQTLTASWYGNDTIWRMVMDLNLIVEYGCSDGTLSDVPQREIISLSDGIIGGQGNGPLKPEPLPLGIISFSNNSAFADIVIGQLMGFDIIKIPLLKNAVEKLKNINVKIFFNNKEIELTDLSEYSIKTIPPKGWADYL